MEVAAIDLSNAPLASFPADLVETPHGSVYLAGFSAVLAFGADGGLRGETGRAGEGPGEFQVISRLGSHGDTLWVGDMQLGRVTRLVDGEVFETLSPPPSLGPSHLARAPDGSIIGVSAVSRGADPSGTERTAWWRWHPETQQTDTLVVVSTLRQDIPVRSSSGMSRLVPQPFSASPVVAFDGVANHLLVAHAAASDDYPSASIVVERVHFDGRRDGAVDVRYRPQRLTEAVVDSVLNLWASVLTPEPPAALRSLPGVVRESPQELLPQLKRATHVPEYAPAVWDIVQGEEGVIWIQRDNPVLGDADPENAKVRWLIAREGEGALARVDLAHIQRPLRATADHVWLFEITNAELGLVRLVKYRIEVP